VVWAIPERWDTSQECAAKGGHALQRSWASSEGQVQMAVWMREAPSRLGFLPGHTDWKYYKTRAYQQMSLRT
jgi:hypothetical protein